ncbi:MAG: lysylphosphatidylglycerol synthase transmembrane domain-containing protein [Pseudomonadota bacterium]
MASSLEHRAGADSAHRDTTPRTRRWRDLVFLGGLFALVLLGLIGLAAATGWEETRAQLAKLTVVEIAILLGLSLINYAFRGMRWHVFSKRLGLDLGFLATQRHFLGGFAMSVTPGRVGELVRMRWIRRETGWPYERSAPLVLVDRASDLAAMAIILGASLALSATGIGGAVPVTIGALLVSVLATRPRLLSSFTTMAYRLLGFWPRIFARIRAAARSLSRFSRIDVFLVAMILGVVGWMAEGYAFYLLLGWFDAGIGFWMALAIFTFATLAGGLTGSPGGVGGAEAAMIALLSLEGVPLEVSVPATAVIRITTLWFAIAIGLAVFPLAEKVSQRKRNELERA